MPTHIPIFDSGTRMAADIDLTTTEREAGAPSSEVGVTLLTGGFDRPYAFGLIMSLASESVKMDVVGADELDEPAVRAVPALKFFNLYGDQRKKIAKRRRILRHFAVYARILRYAAKAQPKIFHILWNNRLYLFDRTLLMLYYKALGKRIVLTAHNVNAGERDGNDVWLNRLSLKAQYRLVDHIFVHTEKMKVDLEQTYGVRKSAVSVIPFGINNSVPDTDLTCSEAKRKIGVSDAERTILFFGGIRPYKGVEHLVRAFQRVARQDRRYRLVIAGEPKKEAARYWSEIQVAIESEASGAQVIQEIRYVSDEETEIFFKAADVLVLPYTYVYQSGVLFLAYNFGLPVIATDVGALRDDIIEGKTGYICRPCDDLGLAQKIQLYFESDLFARLQQNRESIKAYAQQRSSWAIVSATTCAVYKTLLGKSR
ncbi:MAG TPA: glycosyltransferase family 4 protein [Terracidiphilus sp.]|jgi:glycosyltransferase involved in cell wall biosynthesis